LTFGIGRQSWRQCEKFESREVSLLVWIHFNPT